MKLLLLGGSGFLSGTMARCALREGYEVWCVTRGQRPMMPRVHSIVADRKDRAAFAATIEKTGLSWDLVVDCIGFSADDGKQDAKVFAHRTGHLVFISTDFLLSPMDRPWKIDETYAVYNDTPYGTGKRAAEVELLRAVNEGNPGMRITILRPCHIYGPGSLLGVVPMHGRDPQLIDRIRRGEPLTLLAGGMLLQQPVFAADLWIMAASCLGNAKTHGEIYFSPGPEVIEARVFYRMLGEILGVPVTIQEVSITDFKKQKWEERTHCANRVYSTEKAKSHGLKIPTTPLKVGLPQHVEAILATSAAGTKV